MDRPTLAELVASVEDMHITWAGDEMKQMALRQCIETMSNTYCTQHSKVDKASAMLGGKGETIVGAWIVQSINEWAIPQERVLVLMSKSYARCSWSSSDGVTHHTRIPISEITSVSKGMYMDASRENMLVESKQEDGQASLFGFTRVLAQMPMVQSAAKALGEDISSFAAEGSARNYFPLLAPSQQGRYSDFLSKMVWIFQGVLQLNQESI